MSRTLSVEHERQTYIWNGQTWFNERDYTIPHQELVQILEQLVPLEGKRALEGELAVDKLQNQLNKLISAKARDDSEAVRKAVLEVYDIVDSLRDKHVSAPFPPEIIESIQREQENSGLKFPKGGREHRSICWNCHKRGTTIIVDKRIDAECDSCRWAICPKCGACQDPKYGECDANYRSASPAESGAADDRAGLK